MTNFSSWSWPWSFLKFLTSITSLILMNIFKHCLDFFLFPLQPFSIHRDFSNRRVYILFKPSQTRLNRFEKFNGSGQMFKSNEVVKRLIILKVKNLHHCFSFVRKRNDSILILLKSCQVWKDFRLKFLMTSKGQKVQGSNHIDGNQVSWCSQVQVPLRLCWKYFWIHVYYT